MFTPHPSVRCALPTSRTSSKTPYYLQTPSTTNMMVKQAEQKNLKLQQLRYVQILYLRGQTASALKALKSQIENDIGFLIKLVEDSVGKELTLSKLANYVYQKDLLNKQLLAQEKAVRIISSSESVAEQLKTLSASLEHTCHKLPLSGITLPFDEVINSVTKIVGDLPDIQVNLLSELCSRVNATVCAMKKELQQLKECDHLIAGFGDLALNEATWKTQTIALY